MCVCVCAALVGTDCMVEPLFCSESENEADQEETEVKGQEEALDEKEMTVDKSLDDDIDSDD